MLRFVVPLLSLALTIYCVIDTVQTDEGSVRNLPKIAWILLVLLFPVVGPIAWLVAGRPQRSGRGPGRFQPPGGPRRPPRGPDDDPEFLGNL